MPWAPRAAMARARSTAVAVSLLPAPARTGTLPPASSSVMETTRFCSSAVMVTLSPVVPQGTSRSMRASTCRRTSRRRAASSRAPDLVKGVTSAVPAPAKERAIGPPLDPFIVPSRAGVDVPQGAQLLARLRGRLPLGRRALDEGPRMGPFAPGAVEKEVQFAPPDADDVRLRARHVMGLRGVARAVVEGHARPPGGQRRGHHLEAPVEGGAEVAVAVRQQAVAGVAGLPPRRRPQHARARPVGGSGT